MISILRAVSLVAGLSRKNTERVSADISEAKNLKPVGFGAAVCVCVHLYITIGKGGWIIREEGKKRKMTIWLSKQVSFSHCLPSHNPAFIS